MADTPEEKARLASLLQAIVKLSEEAGLYDDESTSDEIVATIKQVRREMAEERAEVRYFQGTYFDDDKCPQCNTAATYELGPNSFACKCTYESEMERKMSYYYPPTYQEGFKSLGIEILEWVTFGTYQGDYAVILKKDDTLGFVVIGYGSCSGCDALEACDSPEEYNELINSVVKDIHWGTTSELLSKINDSFDDNNWYRHDSDFNENKAKLIDALTKEQK